MDINLFDIVNDIKKSKLVQDAGDFVKATTGFDMEKRPFAGCPRLCFIAPEYCDVCAPYKRRIEQALRYIDNREEYYARFELGGPETPQGGERICHFCDAPAELDATVCEYCGTDLSAGGIIRVAQESDVPDPIMAAYDIICERQKLFQEAQREKSSTGLIKGAYGLTQSAVHKMADVETRMTLSEIEETANEYGVSVRAYLEGLDRDKYSTATGKKRLDVLSRVADTMEQNRQRTAATNAQIRAANSKTANVAPAAPASAGRSPTFMELHAKTASSPGYAGKGHGSCCGNCQYYMPESNECAHNKYRHPGGASDYCGSYRKK